MLKILKSEWYCDFCGKHQDEVEVIITGPDGHAICDLCTEIAMQVVNEKKSEKEAQK